MCEDGCVRAGECGSSKTTLTDYYPLQIPAYNICLDDCLLCAGVKCWSGNELS